MNTHTRASLAAFIAVALAAALLLVANVAGVARADAPAKLVCTGTVEGGTFHSVTVPTGESCTLLGVTVLHNVKALHGANNVRVLDSTVGNNVIVKRARGLVHVGQADCKFDPEVRGNVIVRQSHDVLVCYVTGHNIMVNRNDGRITVRDNVAHRIDVSRNLRYRVGPVITDLEHARRPIVGWPTHVRPHAIRILRNEARQHIHVKHNHRSRPVITKGNTPGARVWY